MGVAFTEIFQLRTPWNLKQKPIPFQDIITYTDIIQVNGPGLHWKPLVTGDLLSPKSPHYICQGTQALNSKPFGNQSASVDMHRLLKCSVAEASKTISDQDNEREEIKLRELCDIADSH